MGYNSLKLLGIPFDVDLIKLIRLNYRYKIQTLKIYKTVTKKSTYAILENNSYKITFSAKIHSSFNSFTQA